MKNRKTWETVVSYLCGIILLSVSIVLAWFVPGAYSDWQDQRLLKVSVLSSRDDIEFLDMKALEMEEQMRILKETKQMLLLGQEVEELGEPELYDCAFAFREELKRWNECGLIDSGYQDCFLLDSYSHMEAVGISISLDRTILKCNMLVFSDDQTSDKVMFAIMDREKDILYYVGILGYHIQNYMAELLGYESLEHMTWQVLEGEMLEHQEDYSSYNFKELCYANAAKITGEPEDVWMDAELDYDTFTGYAGRRLVSFSGNYGLSVFLGSEQWNEVLMSIFMEYDWVIPTWEWQKRMVFAYYGVEIEKADVNISKELPYAEVYDEEMEKKIRKEQAE